MHSIIYASSSFPSFINLCVHSCVHSNVWFHVSTHSFIYSPAIESNNEFIHNFTTLLILPSIRSFIPSFRLSFIIHSFMHLFIHSSIYSSILSYVHFFNPPTHSLFYWFIVSFLHSFIHPFVVISTFHIVLFFNPDPDPGRMPSATTPITSQCLPRSPIPLGGCNTGLTLSYENTHNENLVPLWSHQDIFQRRIARRFHSILSPLLRQFPRGWTILRTTRNP